MEVLLLIDAFLFTVASQRCPNRWLERPGADSCYRLWSSPLKSWNGARGVCHTHDGELLKLDSQEEKVRCRLFIFCIKLDLLYHCITDVI